MSPLPPWRPDDVTDVIRQHSTRPDPPLDWTEDGPMPKGVRADVFVAIAHPREDGAVSVVVMPVRGLYRFPQDGRA